MVKCPHCKRSGWRIEVIKPKKSDFRLTAVVCDYCDAPAGFLDLFNIGDMLMTIEKKIQGRLG